MRACVTPRAAVNSTTHQHPAPTSTHDDAGLAMGSSALTLVAENSARTQEVRTQSPSEDINHW
eukprot:5695954-Prymnesium_polylepis.1